MENEYLNPLKLDSSYKNPDKNKIQSFYLSADFIAYNRYTENGYHEKINNALRTGYSDDISVQNDILSLDKLFEQIPSIHIPQTDIKVYRGTVLTEELKEILNGNSKTDVFTDKAFVSTSKRKDVAEHFAEPFFIRNQDKILLQITIPKGSKVIDDEKIPSAFRSKMSNEKEVLLPRNAQFRVLSYDKENKIVDVIYLGQKQPLEMPQIYQCSGFDILADINKATLFNGKNKTPFDKEYNSKNKLY